MGNKKKSFDSYSKKPLRDEVRKAMKRYFNQLDQSNIPIDVYQLVLNEIEPPLLNSVMNFSNNNQSKAAKILDDRFNLFISVGSEAASHPVYSITPNVVKE